MAYHREMTEARPEEKEPTSLDRKPEVAHHEVPKEDTEMMLVRGPRKRHRYQKLAP
jgi:hypothetical protein